MFPLKDENPSGIKPVMTYFLIFINLICFLWQLTVGIEGSALYFGFIPGLFFQDPSENLYRLFTSMFLHGGFTHIFGNMLYLFIFGDNIEAAFGRTKYLLMYVIWGLAAALLHGVFNLNSVIPTIGASGAISGILGAYFVLFPHANILTLIFFFNIATVRRVKSFYYLGFWFLYQLIPASLGEITGIAYWAHIGGFIAGAITALPLRSRIMRRRRELYPYSWIYEEEDRFPYS
ncbi:MAG TPA: rhomboid family intramembrane serine protease [Candidatus Korarchaeota archaeon]|nr:rhomboid family intramembrane serine protease [Candidatus Korarchaeota archaeon]